MMSIDSSAVLDGSSISPRQWEYAWNPDDILIRFGLGGVFVGLLLLVPLGWVIGVYALPAPLITPLLGAVFGYVIWTRSCAAVDDAYQEILTTLVDEVGSSENAQVWISPLEGTGNQRRLEPASEYVFTRIECADEYTLVERITIELASLETAVQSERIPAEKILSQSVEAGRFTLDSTVGSWTIHDIERISE